nr:mucin-2-like isoform X1 [Crassostrea gigas]
MKAEDKIYYDKSRYLCELQNSLGNFNFTMMRKFWFVAILTIFSGIKAVQSQCLPGYYIVCSHNEAIRCNVNGNNRCECYCSQDSQCNNCPTGTLGFCVNEKCVCETNNYCPGGNRFYCLKNFPCAHSESKRCNQNDRCECFCDINTDCKNCPEKGFCVDGSCVCESQNYCPKGNHLYCISLSCDRGYTSKCNSTNHCYCAYVPDTCSNHDVSKCYHLACSAGEKKYCEGRTCTCKPLDYCQQNDDCKNCPEKGFCVDGRCVCESQNYCPKGNHLYCISLSCDRGYTSKCNSTNHCYCAYVPDTCSNHDLSKCYHLTCSSGEKKYCDGRTCTCKPLDYCQQNDGDCQHKTCDASKGEVKMCLSGTCGCLAIPDFCGGDDTSTCQHTICNWYQVKKCENGMCKCQVNPSCNTKEGLNDTCTPENTYLELKGSDGKSYYANCTDSFHYPLCIEDRCQCVYWKTPPPNFTSEGSTIPTNSMTDMAGSTVSSTVTSHTTEAMTDRIPPIPTDQPTGASQTTTQAPVPSTTSAHTVSPTTTFSTSVDTTASTTNTTPLSTSHPPLTTTTTTTTTAAICASRMDCNQQNTHATFLSFTMPCPVDHIDCVNSMCFCSIDKITTTTRASSTTTTTPVPTTEATTTPTTTTTPVPTTTTPVPTTTATTTTPVPTTIATTTTPPTTTPVPTTTTPVTTTTTTPVTITTATTTTVTTTTPVPTTTTSPTTTHQTSGCNKSGSKPCPSCDANLNCVWNQTCADSETCMVRGVLEHGFQFSVHCILSSDCHLMNFLSNYTAEIYCCDDRSCLQRYLGV